jgi:hypothetical protein
MTRHPHAARFLAGWLVCVAPFLLALLAIPTLS